MWRLALCLAPCFFIAACGVPPFDPDEETAGITVTIPADQFTTGTVAVNGRHMHYVATGDASKQPVVFIHGAPGSWQAWGRYLADQQLLEHFFLISIDRPGYGRSDPGQFVGSLTLQAELVLGVLRQLTAQPAIVVGHSYGGPVATRMAIDAPDRVHSMILLAPSVDPDLERTKWFQYPATWPGLNLLVPEALDVANREIFPLKQELVVMGDAWERIHAPIITIQGLQDTLVPPGNADYIEEKTLHDSVETFRIPAQGHFLPWERYALVKLSIQRIAGRSVNLQKAARQL